MRSNSTNFVWIVMWLSSLVLLLQTGQATAATFSVTESSCVASPGGYQWAIEQANSSPGHDIISIDIPEFTMNDCVIQGSDDLPIAITESVDIVGNGNTANGNVAYVNSQGFVNSSAGICPTRSDIAWASMGGSLIDVGVRNTDSSGIEVTISGLNMKLLTRIGRIRENAKLTIEDATIENVLSVTLSCNTPLIEAEPGADLTIRNTDFYRLSVPGGGGQSQQDGSTGYPWQPSTAVIAGYDAGELTMDRVSVVDSLGREAALVIWEGGAVKIVSSRFFESGGLVFYNSSVDFVNSIFHKSLPSPGQYRDNIFLYNGAVLNSEASTFYWTSLGCRPERNCVVTGSIGTYSIFGMGLGTSNNKGALPSVHFKSSALGSIEPPEPLQKLWGDPDVFSSDAFTWIQPTAGQDATELAAILPNALTATPGLTTTAFTDSAFEQTLPLIPGVLLEAVPDAGPGGSNELLSPIDGLPILLDANGNPRVYANGTRNIGAVQNIDSPILIAVPTDAQVNLTWTPTPTGQAQGYEICTSDTALTDPLTGACSGTLTPAGAGETSTMITGLTNGSPYWFAIRVPNGIWSTVATATPMGSLGIAQPTGATISDGSVQVSWSAPASTGGYTGSFVYNIFYRPLGNQGWLLGPQQIVTNSTLFTGLNNGTTYEFGVLAETSDSGRAPSLGTITATPLAPPTLSYAQPGSWPQGKPLTLTPVIGQLQGIGAFFLSAGVLPTGMTLDPNTGVISGTPTTPESTNVTIVIVDGATGLFRETDVPLTIIAPIPGPQLWYPTIQATVGVGPVTSTPTQSEIPTGAAWSVVDGDTLPAGFALDPATGIISGTPSAAPGKVVAITIKACWGGCVPAAGEVHLAPMVFWIVPNLQYPASIQSTAGVPVSVTPVVNLWGGGQFSIESGNLPTGLSLDPVTGVISGTPETFSTNPFTVRYSTGVNVTEPPLQYVYSATEIKVNSPLIVLTYPDTNAYTGSNLSVQPTVKGVTDPAVYSIVTGPLPPTLTLDPATGIISGVPTDRPGSYPIVIEVTDLYGSQRTTLLIELKDAIAAIPTLSFYFLVLLAALLVILGAGMLARQEE